MGIFVIGMLSGLFSAMFLVPLLRTCLFSTMGKPENAHSFVDGFFRSTTDEARRTLLEYLLRRWCPHCGRNVSQCPKAMEVMSSLGDP